MKVPYPQYVALLICVLGFAPLRADEPNRLRENLPKEMKAVRDLVKGQISFLTLYSNDTIQWPEPGTFYYIAKSNLKGLLKPDDTQPAGDRGPVAPKVEGTDAVKQLSRDNWKAIGEVATPVLDDDPAHLEKKP